MQLRLAQIEVTGRQSKEDAQSDSASRTYRQVEQGGRIVRQRKQDVQVDRASRTHSQASRTYRQIEQVGRIVRQVDKSAHSQDEKIPAETPDTKFYKKRSKPWKEVTRRCSSTPLQHISVSRIHPFIPPTHPLTSLEKKPEIFIIKEQLSMDLYCLINKTKTDLMDRSR